MSPALPRPWFVTVTALWSDADGFDKLRALMNGPDGFRASLAAHHLPMPEARWHSTLFAILRANAALGEVTAEQQVTELLMELAALPELLPQLREAFSPLELEAYELCCFDSTTSVQFRSPDGELAGFRAKLSSIFGEAARALCARWNDRALARAWSAHHGQPTFVSLISDPSKNNGGHAFGAVARCPAMSPANSLRWRRELRPIRLRFDRVLLAASDDALCNPHAITGAIEIQARPRA